MKVCWLSNYYSPYKMRLFEELSKYIELTAIMIGGSERNRNSEWVLNNTHHYKVVLIDRNYCSKIKKLAKKNDILIDSMYSTAYGYLAVSAFKNENKKTVMYADGGIPIDRGRVVNGILSFLMKRHDSYFSTGPNCDKYYSFYGVNGNLIQHYRFSSLINKDVVDNENLLKKKNEFRRELGIDEKFTILSVGQPIERKGFDILLESYIKTGLTDKINLYIVGGKPLDKVQKIVDENKLKNVHFIGLLNSKELNKYYVSSDTFVLCTREDIWGLVIEEAMSFGLPTITSDNCAAGIHFNQINKSVQICGVNDTNLYAKRIMELVNNAEIRKEMSLKSLDIIKQYTIENSAVDINRNLNNI